MTSIQHKSATEFPIHKTGREAEDLAYQFLLKQGLKPVLRNFRCKQGEIDLIMQDKNVLIFVEVRYRKSSHFGSSAESVTRTKQAKLIRAASYYLQQNSKMAKYPARFDVIAISPINGQDMIDWIPDAFDAG